MTIRRRSDLKIDSFTQPSDTPDLGSACGSKCSDVTSVAAPGYCADMVRMVAQLTGLPLSMYPLSSCGVPLWYQDHMAYQHLHPGRLMSLPLATVAKLEFHVGLPSGLVQVHQHVPISTHFHHCSGLRPYHYIILAAGLHVCSGLLP